MRKIVGSWKKLHNVGIAPRSPIMNTFAPRSKAKEINMDPEVKFTIIWEIYPSLITFLREDSSSVSFKVSLVGKIILKNVYKLFD
jgi:hypothetical protein